LVPQGVEGFNTVHPKYHQSSITRRMRTRVGQLYKTDGHQISVQVAPPGRAAWGYPRSPRGGKVTSKDPCWWGGGSGADKHALWSGRVSFSTGQWPSDIVTQRHWMLRKKNRPRGTKIDTGPVAGSSPEDTKNHGTQTNGPLKLGLRIRGKKASCHSSVRHLKERPI